MPPDSGHTPRSASADEPKSGLQPVRIPHKLRVVLRMEEVGSLIAASASLKHQTVLSVAYGTGLRASEVAALKVTDIDCERLTLRVEQGKGRKGR